ncbi:MAG: hypothetical protein NTZ21_11895 [Actinobacteria bacterium]|nr:hypothetical protein [Actinomycetota bacterium]
MLVYVVERVYRDAERANSIVSVWSDLERAHAWAERHRANGQVDDEESTIAIRVTEVAVPISGSADLREAV